MTRARHFPGRALLWTLFAASLLGTLLWLSGGLPAPELAGFRDQALFWQRMHQGLHAWHLQQPVLAASVFLAVVVLARMLPIPTGFLLAFAGGLLFGPLFAAGLIAIGAGVSAVCIAVLGRWLFRAPIERRLGDRIRSLETGVQRDGFQCLLSARLIPILPATVVNLIPVLVPIPLVQVFLATVLGLLPMAYLTARLGAEAGSIHAAEGLVLPQGVVWTLTLFALLVLLPVPVRWWRTRRSRAFNRSGGCR